MKPSSPGPQSVCRRPCLELIILSYKNILHDVQVTANVQSQLLSPLKSISAASSQSSVEVPHVQLVLAPFLNRHIPQKHIEELLSAMEDSNFKVVQYDTVYKVLTTFSV